MMLLALPMLAITSCSDDENGNLGKDEVPLFKDYSQVIGKDSKDVQKWMGEEPDEEYSTTGLEVFYPASDTNVDFVFVVYSIEPGIINKKCVAVDSYLSSKLTTTQVTNYLAKCYDFDEVDEDGDYWYYYKDYVILYTPAYTDEDGDYAGNDVYYADKKAFETRGVDFKAAIKAHRAQIRK